MKKSEKKEEIEKIETKIETVESEEEDFMNSFNLRDLLSMWLPKMEKKKVRVGRGTGSKRGKTCCRGHKGMSARSGGKTSPGFEGGQMPIYRRVPKFGFKNFNRKEYSGINIDVLQKLAETKNLQVIDIDVLKENGLISKNDLVKILGRGELKAKLEVKAHAFTQTAIKAIEANGGVATTI